MSVSKVMKQVEIHGRDELELELRLRTLRQALRVRSGAILDVKRPVDGSDSAHSASVVYQLPLPVR